MSKEDILSKTLNEVTKQPMWVSGEKVFQGIETSVYLMHQLLNAREKKKLDITSVPEK